jgi:hypothetical protein
MDGESFDRLSVVVHTLRDRATRRGALRLLLGGSVAAVGGLLGRETAANQRNHNNDCRGIPAKCDHDGDCCSNNCINGRCFPRGGGGGGKKRCGNTTCSSGLKCCKINGYPYCVYPTHPACDDDNNICPAGWDHCGNKFNICCGPNQQCCGHGRCCPDLSGWKCGKTACEYRRSSRSSAPDRTEPFSKPVKVDENGEPTR